jgi:hypothetical protein
LEPDAPQLLASFVLVGCGATDEDIGSHQQAWGCATFLAMMKRGFKKVESIGTVL